MIDNTVVSSDLDRTLIYSPAALQLSDADEQVPTLAAVEVLEGRPHSFMTLRAARQLTRVAEAATFVPTTTRTVAQFRRVRFVDIAPEWAVTSNGGNILFRGEVDQGWHRRLEAQIDATGTSLAQVKHELREHTDPSWALKRRVGDELFCYLVVDPALMPDDFLPWWHQWCAERGWVVSVQARKVYAIPSPLSKENAIAEVMARVGGQRLLAAGDGALDAGLLRVADAGFRPPHGELDELGWLHPTVVVGSRPGVAAGEDVSTWFADQLGLDPMR